MARDASVVRESRVQDGQVDAPVLGLNVLVALNDAALAAHLQVQMGAQGCPATVVANGRDALSAMRSQAFDILLTCRDLAGIDGIGLTRRLRRLRDRHIHIVFAADAADDDAKREALEAGVDDILPTPTTALDIALAIASARRVVAMHRRLSLQNQQLREAQSAVDLQLKSLRASLTAAATLQHGLLPAPITTGPYRLARFFMPSQEIGGDVLGAQQLPNGNLFFFNVDVAGHGVPAALEAFALHSRLAFPPPDTPERLKFVADRLNAELLSRDGNSATVVMGILSADGSSVTLLRAGHPPPVLIPRVGTPRFVNDGGLPLGFFAGIDQPLVTLDLAPGDRLLVYSDGVTDCDGHAGGLGVDGLLEFWLKVRHVPLETAIGEFECQLRQANRQKPPEDDLSVLVIERA